VGVGGGHGIRGVSFDIGGTLVADEGGRKRRLARLAGRDPEAIDEAYRRHFLTRRGGEEEALAGLAAEIGVPDLPSRARRAGVAGPPSLYPDVLPTLRSLRGMRLAVISNCSWVDRRRFEAMEIAAAFDAEVFSCDIARAKPDPEPFRLAHRLLGLPAEQVLHVGDDPLGDIAGAAGLGCPTAFVRRGSDSPRCPQATWEVSGLDELAAILS
jgi:HAD superfamily hydrolase (TIGR01549 family)